MSFRDWYDNSFRIADEYIRNMLTEVYEGKLDAGLIGTYPTDYLEVESDGTLVLHGEATVWEDIQSSLIGAKLQSSAGKVDYDYVNNTVVFSPGGVITTANDLVNFSLQLPHATKVDSTLRLHIHWIQPDDTAREFTIMHRVQPTGGATATTWVTTVVDAGDGVLDAFPYVSGNLNQITSLVDVDLTDAGISAIVQFKMTRTDSETGDIAGTFVDAHVELDTLGSNSEFVK